MEYQYIKERESDNYPVRMGVERWFSSSVDENGIFEVPENHPKIDEITTRLEELGHEPVGGNNSTGDESPEPDLTEVSEEDLVTASYDELRSIASDFEDIDGRSSQGELEEALITKRREQE